MRISRLAAALVVALFLAAAPAGAQQAEPFSFYGLRFGAMRAEVGKLVALQENLVKNPGHGMSDLELVFDRENELMEIRASWPRPDEPLAYQGFLRALRERFVSPTNAKYPAVAVTLDEHSNRAAVRLVFLSIGIRERTIEFHKSNFLKTLQ